MTRQKIKKKQPLFNHINEKNKSVGSSDWGLSQTYSKWRHFKPEEESGIKDELNLTLSSDWGTGRPCNLSHSQRDSDKEKDVDDIPSLTPGKDVSSHKQNVNDSSETLTDISPSYPVQ